MKALVYREYGSPDVLKLAEVPVPEPNEHEVLIKVHSVSINASDIEFLTGSPAYTRSWGVRKPKHTILGSDIAGVVEQVGASVTQFKPGDAVFGDVLYSWGGFAEYVCAPEKQLLLKPDFLSFVQAASLPQAGSVALQGLRDKGKLESGQHVLINGAGGGSGSFAVQLAKHFGAEVTGVDSAEKLSAMRDYGADHVIDYQSENFTRNGQQYDLILDFIAAHSIFAYKRSLTANGRYVMVGGNIPHLIQATLIGSLISVLSHQSLGLLMAEQNKDLAVLMVLIKTGKITPVIDRQYALYNAADAMQYFYDGHAKGKVVILVE